MSEVFRAYLELLNREELEAYRHRQLLHALMHAKPPDEPEVLKELELESTNGNA